VGDDALVTHLEPDADLALVLREALVEAMLRFIEKDLDRRAMRSNL